MKVLAKNNWIDVPLDYALCEGEHRINVQFMLNISRIDDVYFQRKKDVRMVWNYIKEIGVIYTLAKIMSRSAEARRNEKYLSVGFGQVHIGNVSRFAYFIAPLHPACADIISCESALLYFSDDIPNSTPDQIKHIHLENNAQRDALMKLCGDIAGWSHYAGSPLPAFDWEAIIGEIRKAANLSQAQLLPITNRTIKTTTTVKTTTTQTKNAKPILSASLFGYGNYAKTVIFPNLPSAIKITRIHEIDPLQVAADAQEKYICSTEPMPSNEDKNSIFFIAGFHHTHADIAIEGLQRGVDTVVEKPLVTTYEQLANLKTAYTNGKGRYFSCFHKRYLNYNQRVRTDLNIGADTPINYHAIVYEVPLPKRHWYRWENSCSRIVSNGCHWIDHFLFLNNFSVTTQHAIDFAPDGTVNVSATLSNGAYFTMVLTDVGSERLGVQDYIELRQNHTTIKMINGTHYQAENSHRILCKLKGNRMDSYKNMYRSIGNRIATQQKGDSWESIANSAELTLAIEDLVKQHQLKST